MYAFSIISSGTGLHAGHTSANSLSTRLSYTQSSSICEGASTKSRSTRDAPQHARARLHRVARGRQVVVQAVAELVQQRLQLLQREALAVEVGHQHRLRHALVARGAGAVAPHRGGPVLAVARIDVHVQRGDGAAGLRIA